jgi:hypothetical protein
VADKPLPSRIWNSFVQKGRRRRPGPLHPLVNPRANIAKEVGQLPPESVIPATSERLPNGDEVLTVQEHYAMHVVFVRELTIFRITPHFSFCIDYAKLMRKQSKQSASQNGEPPPKIDMDMLKASTRAAEAEKNAAGGGKSISDENTAPDGMGGANHHQGSFHVSVLSPAEAQGQGSPTMATPTSASDPSRLPAHHQTILPPPPANGSGSMHPPPPPWAANVTRNFAAAAAPPPPDPFSSQSFMRTVNHISPR